MSLFPDRVLWAGRATGALLTGLLLTGFLLFTGAARAGSIGGSLGVCEEPPAPSAARRDRLLRVAALLKDELARSGRQVALVSRSGTDLRLFDLRYSHAGVALKASANGPWSVRQLYFACEEQRPRLFDQGMAGFVFGSDGAGAGFVSLVLLPDTAAAALERAALDNRRALGLLAATYSANAYAYALDYQNCNQWVAELLAEAWGNSGRDAWFDTWFEPEAESAAIRREEPLAPAARRAAAQAWLSAQGYLPHPFEMPWAPLASLAGLLPWLHSDDHPAQEIAAGRFGVSMPGSLEAFVRRQVPGAERVELCHQGDRAVLRRGWQPLGRDCLAAEGDDVIALD